MKFWVWQVQHQWAWRGSWLDALHTPPATSPFEKRAPQEPDDKLRRVCGRSGGDVIFGGHTLNHMELEQKFGWRNLYLRRGAGERVREDEQEENRGGGRVREEG